MANRYTGSSMQHALKSWVLQQASAPYRRASRFDWGWAKGKLRHDPVFPALIELRLLPDGAKVLDLGCGRGLLAAWLLAAERAAAEGRWTAGSAPPQGLRFEGVELMAREAECGNQVLQPLYGQRVQLRGGDLREVDVRGFDVVTVFDVLHYLPYADQDRFIAHVADALPEGGLFVTRVGDAAGGWRFRASQWVDRSISFAQGHRLPRMWCRQLGEWVAQLERSGFAVQCVPMSQGTPFANTLLAARRLPRPSFGKPLPH